MSKFKKGDRVRNVSDVWPGTVIVGGEYTVLCVRDNFAKWGDSHTFSIQLAELMETSPYHYRRENQYELVSRPANAFELKGYTEGGMYVDHRFVSGPDEAKEYIEGAQGPSNAVHYKLFEHVPAAEFKVSSVTTRTVAQV